MNQTVKYTLQHRRLSRLMQNHRLKGHANGTAEQIGDPYVQKTDWQLPVPCKMSGQIPADHDKQWYTGHKQITHNHHNQHALSLDRCAIERTIIEKMNTDDKKQCACLHQINPIIPLFFHDSFFLYSLQRQQYTLPAFHIVFANASLFPASLHRQKKRTDSQ